MRQIETAFSKVIKIQSHEYNLFFLLTLFLKFKIHHYLLCGKEF